jgi:hypothetical protein
MAITSEFTKSPDLHSMAWAALMEDLAAFNVTPDLVQHVDICKQFLHIDPETWHNQVHFCRVCLTHDKNRVKIQFWIDPKLDRLGDAICALASSLNAVIYHNPPPRSQKCWQAISSIEAIRYIRLSITCVVQSRSEAAPCAHEPISHVGHFTLSRPCQLRNFHIFRTVVGLGLQQSTVNSQQSGCILVACGGFLCALVRSFCLGLVDFGGLWLPAVCTLGHPIQLPAYNFRPAVSRLRPPASSVRLAVCVCLGGPASTAGIKW